jgi:trimeric autotransporter adhesin
MVFRRTHARLAAVILLALGLVSGLGLTASAQAATSDLSDRVSSTYQTNGRVAAILTVGDIVYIGGDFTSVRPAGAAALTQETPRARLAAFKISTGELLPWNPGADKSVYALAASPDGQTVYVGGSFTQIAGVTRKHVAAVTAAVTADGGVATSFVANTDSNVRALAVSGSPVSGCPPLGCRVYLGGNFTAVNGVPRSRVAAVDPVTGTVNPVWAPSANNTVRTITLSPDGTSVYIGGDF